MRITTLVLYVAERVKPESEYSVAVAYAPMLSGPWFLILVKNGGGIEVCVPLSNEILADRNRLSTCASCAYNQDDEYGNCEKDG